MSTAQTTNSGVYYANEIDFSKVSYSELKQMGNGPAKTCYLNYNGGNLVIETPWLNSSFGIRQPPPEYREEGAPPKYSIEFSLKGFRGENEKAKELYDCLQSLQDKLLEDSCTHAMEWHKKKTMSKDVAEALFTPLVKFAKDKNTGEPTDMYPPTLKVKVPYWEGTWNCKAMVKGTGQFVEGDLSEHVCGRINARAIIECSSLWFAGGKFGASWKLKMIEYVPSEQAVLSDYSFRNPTPITETEEVSMEQSHGGQEEDEIIEDSDEEVVEED